MIEGGLPVPDGAEEWFGEQQKAALKRDKGVCDVIKALGESDLEGDAFLDLMEAETAKIKRPA